MKQYCLYRHFDDEGLLLYVGVSINPCVRLACHKFASEWYPQIATITIERFNVKQDALDAEYNAMLFERPKFNKNGATGNYEAGAEIMGMTLEEIRQKLKRGGERQKARRDQIKAFHASGKTMAEVATQFGISRGRAWQIVRDYK